MFTWGCGESGQLGHDSDDNVMFPKVIQANLGNVVGMVSCGEHHVAVMTSTPWNKFGQDVNQWLREGR